MDTIFEFMKKNFSEKNLRVTFLVFALLRCIFKFELVIGPLTKLLLIWAIILILNDLVRDRLYFKNKFKFILVLFWLMYGVSILLNYKDNLTSNISSYLYLFIKIFLMYSYNDKDDIYNKNNELKIFNNTFIVITFIGAVLSLLVVIFNISLSSDGYLLGVFAGRLWGIFGNPNTCGILAVISIIFTYINFNLFNSNTLIKVVMVINVFLQLSVLGLSGSRGAILSLVAAIMLSILFMLIKNIKSIFNKKMYVFKLLILCIILPLTCFGYFKLSTNILSKLVLFNMNTGQTIIESTNNSTNASTDKDNIVLERQSYGEAGGGRIRLWKSGIEVIANKPAFGVTAQNIESSIRKYTDNYTEDEKVVAGMHNEIMQILVSSGIVGLSLFLIFAFMFIYIIFKSLKKQYMDNKFCEQQIFCIIVLGTIVFNNMFESGIVYTVMHYSILFWSYLGFCMYYTQKSNY